MIDTEEIMAEGWEEPEEDIEEEDKLFHDIYVETASGMIHEVHMFDGFCLVRPASPNTYATIRKLGHVQFSGEFHEYGGDPEAVREFLRSSDIDIIVE